MSSEAAVIDLRSDTVTRPSSAMREAMSHAAVGDDQYGDDPTMNTLQERIADELRKERALWFPSGTMANQVALKILTQPGDEVVVSRECHAVWHEAGGSAANSGVQFAEIGNDGIFTREEFIAAVKPGHLDIYAPTTLVQIENTHNRSGGRIFPQNDIEAICRAARERKIATYLDGARLWNVAVATGQSVNQLAAPFDLVMVAMSKGLGAPGGALLAGPHDLLARAVRQRRMLGGAMRQVGFYAAAGLYALDHNRERLSEDHAKAMAMARVLAQSDRIDLDPATVDTNIIVFKLTGDAPAAEQVVAAAKQQNVLINQFGPGIIRLVTHLDVSAEQCQQAASILLDVIEP